MTAWAELWPDFAIQRIPCAERASAHGLIARNNQVEATINQVNQFGGYTGMRHKDYAAMILSIAKKIGFPKEKIILCGDHLGPYIWTDLPEKEAMERSCELIRECVAAGFRKIHLDPTIPVADDEPGKPLSDEVIAKRAALMAKVSEETFEKTKNDTPWTFRPVYVIGSEVPMPGGTKEDEGISVTTAEDLYKSIECFRNAFLDNGLPQVWDDVVAVVAQIGVEFSDEAVYQYDYNNALPIIQLLEKKYPNLMFESHSADYQPQSCLVDMVRGRTRLLKTGPECTFQMREGLFALEHIERELQPLYGFDLSNFSKTLDYVMTTERSSYWEGYYGGSEYEKYLKRQYSFSDRSRYYMTHGEVRAAMNKLLGNLDSVEIPLMLISQYMPVQFENIRDRKLDKKSNATILLKDKVLREWERHYVAMLQGTGREKEAEKILNSRK